MVYFTSEFRDILTPQHNQQQIQQQQNQQQNQQQHRNFPPAQTGKSRPEKSAFSRGESKKSDELKDILSGLQMDDAEANAIATDLEDVLNSDSDSPSKDVRQVQFKDKKDASIRLA